MKSGVVSCSALFANTIVERIDGLIRMYNGFSEGSQCRTVLWVGFNQSHLLPVTCNTQRKIFLHLAASSSPPCRLALSTRACSAVHWFNPYVIVSLPACILSIESLTNNASLRSRCRFHPCPAPQFVVNMSGVWYIRTRYMPASHAIPNSAPANVIDMTLHPCCFWQ